jgi:hypothetical protein
MTARQSGSSECGGRDGEPDSPTNDTIPDSQGDGPEVDIIEQSPDSQAAFEYLQTQDAISIKKPRSAYEMTFNSPSEALEFVIGALRSHEFSVHPAICLYYWHLGKFLEENPQDDLNADVSSMLKDLGANFTSWIGGNYDNEHFRSLPQERQTSIALALEDMIDLVSDDPGIDDQLAETILGFLGFELRNTGTEAQELWFRPDVFYALTSLRGLNDISTIEAFVENRGTERSIAFVHDSSSDAGEIFFTYPNKETFLKNIGVIRDFCRKRLGERVRV